MGLHKSCVWILCSDEESDLRLGHPPERASWPLSRTHCLGRKSYPPWALRVAHDMSAILTRHRLPATHLRRPSSNSCSSSTAPGNQQLCSVPDSVPYAIAATACAPPASTSVLAPTWRPARIRNTHALYPPCSRCTTLTFLAM